MRFHLDKNALSNRTKGVAAAIIVAVEPCNCYYGIVAGLHYTVDEYRWFGSTMYKLFYLKFQVWGFVVLESLLVFVAYSKVKMRPE